jgi:integrase
MNDTRQAREYLHKEPDGYWRYIRRVPKDAQAAVGKAIWRASLGKDKVLARARAKELEREHDAMLAALRDPSTAQDSRLHLIRQRSLARMAELEARGAPDGRDDQGDPDNGGSPYSDALPADTGTVESVLADMWKRVPAILEDSEGDDPDLRTRRLSAIAALAFGDQSRAQMEGLPSLPSPVGKVAAMQYAAHKAMLDEVLEEIAPTPDDTPAEMRLTALLPKYLTAQAVRPNTASGYSRKVARLVNFAGDHGLQQYDEATFRAYRDYLIAGDPAAKPKPLEPVKAATVHQYFAPLKALWKWAADEYPEHKELSFPRVRLPKDGETVEETRWQAFDDHQIKRVWQLLNDAWGEKADSRLSPSRRAAFLMAVRVLLYTGMRPSEVFRLTAGDVKDGGLNIRYTKTKQARRIPLAAALSDFPEFLAAGGFAAELEAGRTAVRRGAVYGKPTTPESLAGTLRDQFREVIRAGGLTHDRHVLYSLKDTLIDRLQRQGASDDVMRGIIGHVGGQGKLRHYKTPFGQSPHGMALMRKALDAIKYW